MCESNISLILSFHQNIQTNDKIYNFLFCFIIAYKRMMFPKRSSGFGVDVSYLTILASKFDIRSLCRLLQSTLGLVILPQIC